MVRKVNGDKREKIYEVFFLCVRLESINETSTFNINSYRMYKIIHFFLALFVRDRRGEERRTNEESMLSEKIWARGFFYIGNKREEWPS